MHRWKDVRNCGGSPARDFFCSTPPAVQPKDVEVCSGGAIWLTTERRWRKSRQRFCGWTKMGLVTTSEKSFFLARWAGLGQQIYNYFSIYWDIADNTDRYYFFNFIIDKTEFNKKFILLIFWMRNIRLPYFRNNLKPLEVY